MSMKYLVLGLGLIVVVVVALTQCGSEQAPAPKSAATKPAVAGSFSANQSTPEPGPYTQVLAEPPLAPAAVPPQPPPGAAQFGPAAPEAPYDQTAEIERQKYADMRARQNGGAAVEDPENPRPRASGKKQ